MKRVATHLFKRQSGLFSKLSNFHCDLKPPGQYRGAENPTPGAGPGELECVNPRGSPRRGGCSGLELTDTLLTLKDISFSLLYLLDTLRERSKIIREGELQIIGGGS